MLQKLVTILIVISFVPLLMFAQDRTKQKPLGTTYTSSSGNQEALPLSKWQTFKMQQSLKNKNRNQNYSSPNTPNNPLTLLDTLYINPPGTLPPTGNSNFGFFGQDRMTMWFVAPADLILKEVGFDFIAINQPPPQLEVKIVEVTKPTEELEYMNDDWWGWFEALGNNQHDATAFWGDPDRTGLWTPSPQAPDPDSTFGVDIWSDNGVGQPFTPNNDTVNIDTYQFIDLSALGYPDIAGGTVFAVVLKNLDPNLGAGTRVGILGPSVGTGGTYQYSLQKYYADANTNAGQCPTLDCYGQWSRDIALSYAAVVEIYGNPAPNINSFTHLGSDVFTGPYTVDANITDENPGNPDSAGVGSAMIQWSTDGGTSWNDVPMTGTEPNYTGEIPVQSPNTTVTYRISATDITNKTATSNSAHFFVFEPSGANTLVIWNGFDDLSGFPQDYYFGMNVDFDHDSWNYGEATSGLLDNYDNVIEIWNENNGDYNDSTIQIWLEGAANRNYLLAGQEYLGAKNGYVDSFYVAGDFEYDILGIDSSFNDISYYSPPPAEASIGDSLPTLITPVAGTMFGQPLKDLFDSYSPAPDSMMFNPLAIFNSPDNLNWQDGFHAIAGVEVDMMVQTRGMGANREQPLVRTIPTLAHRTLTAGNKVIFHAYDPVSLTTADDSSFAYFNWVSEDTLNTMYQALKWFGIETTIVGVNDYNYGPSSFALEQNFPNPFNPSTTIKFTVPQYSKVTLKVFDILGREVSTLINENKSAGDYIVNFDASALASGMYIYKLTAGDFTAAKKMMLLK